MLGMGNKKTETQKDVAGVRTRSMSKKGSVAIAALAADVEMDVELGMSPLLFMVRFFEGILAQGRR